VRGDVADDRADLAILQRIAIDLAAHRIKARGRPGLFDGDRCAFGKAETAISLLAEPDLAGRQQAGFIHQGERRKDLRLFATDPDLPQCLKLLGGIAIALAQEKGGVFRIGVDGEAFDLQHFTSYTLRSAIAAPPCAVS